MRTTIRLVLIAAFAAILFAIAAGGASGGAIVLKNEEVGCFTDPGDIPGAPGFPMPKATVVILPSGGVQLSCHGMLPAGFTLEATVVRTIACFGPPPLAPTTGHLVATPSGHVSFTCKFDAPAS
jgi:hypothetical protein